MATKPDAVRAESADETLHFPLLSLVRLAHSRQPEILASMSIAQ